MQLGNKTLPIPILQGGMGVGVSLGNLAGHVARAGGMGIISTANPGYRAPNFWHNAQAENEIALRAEIAKAKEIADGNGLVAVNAMVATQDYENAVRTAARAGADTIICGAGLPLTLPILTEGSDALLAPIVSSGRAAGLLCRAWQKKYNRLPDFFVLEGSEAGGHLGFSAQELETGTAKPLETLLPEVQEATAPFYGAQGVPIFVAGGVYSGEDVRDWLARGAAGVQIATRFIATEECDASRAYKEILVRAQPDDVVLVKSPVGMPGRALRSPLIEKVARGERVPPAVCARCIVSCKPAETPYCITRALVDAVEGKWETGLFFCGSNAGRVQEITTVAALMQELTALL